MERFRSIFDFQKLRRREDLAVEVNGETSHSGPGKAACLNRGKLYPPGNAAFATEQLHAD